MLPLTFVFVNVNAVILNYCWRNCRGWMFGGRIFNC